MQIIDSVLKNTPDTTLFHYTTGSGFLGIMNTGEIWASSVYHLNDAEEFRYAASLISKRLEDRRATMTDASYQWIKDAIETMPKGLQVFVASFSQEHDLLSQWLSYSGTNGYSICINAAQARVATTAGFTLVRCEYEPDAQVRLADTVLDIFHGTANGIAQDEAMQKALIVAAAIKHPGFAKEAEWRLVKAIPVKRIDRTVSFRQGRNGIVPYISVPLGNEDSRYIPGSIVIGPNADMDAADLALESFLWGRGYRRPYPLPQEVVVVRSKTPYRP